MVQWLLHAIRCLNLPSNLGESLTKTTTAVVGPLSWWWFSSPCWPQVCLRHA